MAIEIELREKEKTLTENNKEEEKIALKSKKNTNKPKAGSTANKKEDEVKRPEKNGKTVRRHWFYHGSPYIRND